MAKPASWTGRLGTTLRNGRPLCCFGNFMKKKGRSGTAGEGWLEQLLVGTWRPTSWGGRLRAGGAEEGEDGKMKGRGERERSGALAEAAAWWRQSVRWQSPSSFLLLLNFISTTCEKFHKPQFHFPFPPHPRHFVLRRPCALPSPVTIVMSP